MHRALLLGSILLFVACASAVDPTSPPGPKGDQAGLAAACRDFFAKRVQYETRCLGASLAVEARFEQANVDSCVGLVEAPGSLLGAADVRACADALKGECSANEGYPSCTSAYNGLLLYPNHDKTGALPAGSACMAQFQCATGYCGPTYDLCGKCLVPKQVGEACDGPTDTCLGSNCLEGRCDSGGKALGEPCIDYGGGDCKKDLRCKVGADHLNGVCVPKGSIGSACGDSDPCTDGLYCGAGTCRARLAAGAACQGGDCKDECVEGACRALRWGLGAGEDCTVDVCAPSLICDGKVCQKLGAKGAFCDQSHYCDLSLDCDAPCDAQGNCKGTCKEKPMPGEPCTAYGTCDRSATCVGFAPSMNARGTCVRLGGEGEACPCGDELTCSGDSCKPFGASLCQ